MNTSIARVEWPIVNTLQRASSRLDAAAGWSRALPSSVRRTLTGEPLTISFEFVLTGDGGGGLRAVRTRTGSRASRLRPVRQRSVDYLTLTRAWVASARRVAAASQATLREGLRRARQQGACLADKIWRSNILI